MFLLMWLAMMVAMMMPSALPTFLKTQRRWVSLCYMASGYFAIWLAAGIGIFVLGVALATVEMRSELISRAVPLLLGASLIAAGAFQFTRWKMTHLLRCRSPFGCATSCPQNETSFRLGCKQGVACCVCCAAPMTILLALGMMNPLVIIVVAIVIAAEKLLPRPAIVARLVGISAIIAGIRVLLCSFPAANVKVTGKPKAEGECASHALGFQPSRFVMRRKLNVDRKNVVRIAMFRHQRDWTREELSARLQLFGCNITPQILAQIETGRCVVTDAQIVFFSEVFGIPAKDLFPMKSQSRDGSA